MSRENKLSTFSNEQEETELPITSNDSGEWGSDVAAQMMRALDIPYVALNAGACFRRLQTA